MRLTRQMLSQSRVIARGMGIREVDRLLAEYGGHCRGWIKKSSPVIVINGLRAEIHWYEHPGIGRVEVKTKWIDRT